MTPTEIKKILAAHAEWLKDSSKGTRANLSSADLRFANLSFANLSFADLSSANLRFADLSFANLHSANLSSADLRFANLSFADLSFADLSSADLSSANLRFADLSSANLHSADLRFANLSFANLSQVKNLLEPYLWLQKLEQDKLGIIVYKAIGQATYAAPEHWEIKKKSIITEVCHPDRTLDCACGVNFGTLEWVKNEYGKKPGTQIWKCRIAWIDLSGVVVPYNTDGNARCSRLQLLEVVK